METRCRNVPVDDGVLITRIIERQFQRLFPRIRVDLVSLSRAVMADRLVVTVATTEEIKEVFAANGGELASCIEERMLRTVRLSEDYGFLETSIKGNDDGWMFWVCLDLEAR